MRKLLLTLFLLSILNICCFQSVQALDIKAYPEIQHFIDKLVKEDKFNRQRLEYLFSQVQLDHKVVAKIEHPTEELPWYKYIKIFTNPSTIQAGVNFWLENADALEAAEKKYGVPAYIIVGLLGVETHYGEREGHYLAIDSLATLAFHHSSRSKYFKQELESFLKLAREQHWNPLTIRSSYAGALGMPQFMPDSYKIYGVKARKGKLDLFRDPADAIFSVANFMKKHGWKRDDPVAIQIHFKVGIIHESKDKNLKFSPYLTYQDFQHKIIQPGQTISPTTKVFPFELNESTQTMSYWLGLNNLSVITRYNDSLDYAMAVFTLGKTVEKAYQEQLKVHLKHLENSEKNESSDVEKEGHVKQWLKKL